MFLMLMFNLFNVCLMFNLYNNVCLMFKCEGGSTKGLHMHIKDQFIKLKY